MKLPTLRAFLCVILVKYTYIKINVRNMGVLFFYSKYWLYICIINKGINNTLKTQKMKNLLPTLSSTLQAKLNDFKVSIIFVEDNEMNVRSDYDMHSTYYDAIRSELTTKGFITSEEAD